MTDIVIDEDGIPRLRDRRIAVSLIVAQIGSSSHSVESFAEEYGVGEGNVRTALCWAARNPDRVDTVFQRRADALRDSSPDYPNGVKPPAESNAEEYLRRARDALAAVEREWQPYSDPRWREE
ncbi:hypothetical protein [Halorussus sp. AFM4]|uniref:hypothetical protein n=1 Tax=Halorussus sp. AFM4 TaxID=3421651 RepID=UPI003EB9A71A